MKRIKFFIAFFLILNLSLYSQIKLHNSIKANKYPSVSIAQINAIENLKQKGIDIQVAWNEFNPTPTFLNGKLTENNYMKNFPSVELAAKNFIEENKTIFNLKSPLEELKLLKTETDNIGMTHTKLQQYYNGLKIMGSQLVVHFDKHGAISSINGRYIPTPKISTVPAIDEAKAKSIASQNCNGVESINSELVIYINDNEPTLAFEVQVPTKIAPKQRVIIDAHSGNVLYKDTGIRFDGPEVGSGIGLNGENRSLNIYLDGSNYYLIDATKSMYVPPIDNLQGVIVTWDAKNSTNETNPYDLAEVVYDPNNDKNFNDNEDLKATVDAHFFTEKVYEYYKTKFNRNSYNNEGGTLMNVIHYQVNYNNAFWNGTFMTYGDGDGEQFSNFAGGFDVIVHEITHGVTSSTADLEYIGQSGALNESYSDVFAAMADDDDWLIGEDIYTPSISGDALRSMSDPNQGGSSLSDPGWQPAHMNEFLYIPYTDDWDLGGVHINSGIPNKACYLVANQIGREKTEQIYYRTLAYYLTPKSQFIDARNATLQSAADLYGAGSSEYNTVASAFDNVGITSNLPKTNELAYDDGSPEILIYETDANWGILNRLTTPSSGKLMNISFYYGGDNNSLGDGSFKIKIYENGGNQPGNLLFTSNTFTPQSGIQDYWLSIGTGNLNLNVNGDFYIGIFYDGIDEPLVGGDTTVINDRAWEWDDTNNEWIHLDENSYFPITLLMRAIVNTVTGIHQISNEIPNDFTLLQNYPNPFNPSTTISYALPKESNVILKVYDILGKEVTLLVNEMQSSGTYNIEWKGVNNQGLGLASGIYIYNLSVNGKNFTKKMILTK